MNNRKIISLRNLLLAVSLLFTPCFAHAQFDVGSLVGTIHDQSGAAVPGASITVTNTATNIQTATTSNSSGDYEVPSLHAGIYTISAKAAGYAEAVAQNITLSVGSRQRIDLELHVGQTETSVQVSDVALGLETDSSQRGQTITQYQTEAFPLVSRNYSDLLALVTGSRQAPTSATTSSINSLTRQGSYNVNGQRSMFNNFLLDGMDNNAYGESNQGFDNQIIAIPPDSVSQWNVVTNNESAEYGRSTGQRLMWPQLAERTGSTPLCTNFCAIRTSTPPATSNRPLLKHRQHRSLSEADLQSQPVRRELRRTNYEGQALLLRGL